MRKLTKYEEEIFHDLLLVLQKIDKIERKKDCAIVSEVFLECIATAIEDLTGIAGMTEQIFRDDSEEKDLEEKSKLD
jgi:hypothetical protein